MCIAFTEKSIAELRLISGAGASSLKSFCNLFGIFEALSFYQMSCAIIPEACRLLADDCDSQIGVCTNPSLDCMQALQHHLADALRKTGVHDGHPSLAQQCPDRPDSSLFGVCVQFMSGRDIASNANVYTWLYPCKATGGYLLRPPFEQLSKQIL